MARSLPAAASSFVGREDELKAIDELFERGARLVTIWAMGGMGKTRLAREIAQRAPESVWVDLAETTTDDGFVAVTAAALGISVASARRATDALRQIGRALEARKNALVVFDNFEQLIPVATDAMTELTNAAPRSRFVVTSRERLRIPGESALELAPLGLPHVEAGAKASDAATLFCDRSKEHGATGLDPTNPHIVDLVRRLEGIPLAIELAAARLEVLGIEGLLERVSRGLDVLSRNVRGAPSRHATMRAAIAWSWDLLDDEERTALGRVAVFRGGFTLEAAETILGAGALDLIESLRDRSLLRVSSGDAAGRRFHLYEAVREFALSTATDVDRNDALARRDDYLLSTSARWWERISRTGDAAASRLLGAELENLLDAQARALAVTPPTKASAQRAAEALLFAEPAHVTRSSSSARVARWRETAQALEAFDPDDVLRAQVEGAMGRAEHASGALDDATALLSTALDRAATAQAGELVASLALDLGLVKHARGDFDGARVSYERALASTARKQTRSEARALGNLAAIDHDEARFDGARGRYERSIAIASGIGDARVEGVMTTNLGVLEQEEGQWQTALGCYERALTLLERAGEARLVAIARGNLSTLLVEQGSLDRAKEELEKSLAALRRMGDAHSIGLALVRLSVTQALGGDAQAARRDLHEARVEFARTNDTTGRRLTDLAGAALELATPSASSRATVREAIERALGGSENERALVEVSDDARTLVRILTSAVDRLERGAPAEAEPRDEALVVTADATWFKPPGGEWQWIGDHQAATLVMRALIAARESHPNAGLSLDDVVKAGWPDQKIRPESAANRVYVLVAWLRKRGLGKVLVRAPGGYLLDAAVPLQRVSRVPSRDPIP